MAKKQQRIGIHELYAEDPIRADQKLWGREGLPNSRRGFLKKSALTAMGVALGAPMVFADNFPLGMIPAGLAHAKEPFSLPGKRDGLVVLNDRPINAETPPHLLDDDLTPNDLFFVRNNGIPPNFEAARPAEVQNTWTLTIEGESARQTKSYSILNSHFAN